MFPPLLPLFVQLALHQSLVKIFPGDLLEIFLAKLLMEMAIAGRVLRLSSRKTNLVQIAVKLCLQ